ncbi:MAG: MAPEG family protein [Alphaproteobacteria bacterium]|nr:MAPEG family protein [Alphaproteobacteria bacterium]MDE1985290.1 MAPEG family protein [Alphaproteobacteria bacterium]MDE2164454.1 MAPEG family protein [Alphaproteobacteria bacterium]MDE2265345.1 MAPEG family protein [Alphaproteobacteria bacterium]MDE2498611.1 MAPEG family protein [Alphaproteobacteria bacterium]
MPADLLSAIVTILAVLLYFYMSIRVGQMREKHHIKAPATSGHEEFDRAFRVQMNTLEALPVFLPLLWLATVYFHAYTWLPAALGLVWVAGRVLYMTSYMADPDKRGVGFGIAAIAQLGLLIVAIVGIVQCWPGA